MMAEVYVGGVHVGTATEVKVVPTEMPLSKPSRVEKWQRWRLQSGDEGIVDRVEHSIVFFRGPANWGTSVQHMFDSWPNAVFLGYAKPDKIEVGQRWSNRGVRYKVDGVSYGVADLGGAIRASVDTMLTSDTFEYLGMTESASEQDDAIRKMAVATGQSADSIRGAANDIKRRYETPPLTLDVAALKHALEQVMPPEHAADRLHAEIHANDKREPIAKRVDSFGRPIPGTQSVIGPPACDPKAEARRANEEAAKRLIANPPEWAYPKAWMCAVLAAQEWNNSHTIVPGMELSSIGWWIAVVCELEHRGRERTATIDGIETVIRDAYARGMARSSPMTRPGVKGGISTCDLGGEYE